MNKDRLITILVCSIAIIYLIVIKAMPHFFFYNGKSAFEKHNYVKAYSNLKKAYYFDKKNKDYRYYFVKTLTNLVPNLEVQKNMFEIASSEEEDSAQSLAENKVTEWKFNVLRNIGDNYIEQTPLDKGIIRWDINKFPIKIKIENNVSVPDYYNVEILRAFNQWTLSTGFIKFSKTDNDADIIVKIMSLPSSTCSDNQNCKYVVGYTTPTIKGRILKYMTIILYDKDPYGNYFSDKELYNIILHEIGHALGIMGHSYSSDDLMYMASENNIYMSYRSAFQYLSSKDINTIKLLYKLIPDVTNSENINTKDLVYAPIVLGSSKEISKRKLKEAQNYIKNAPNLAGGYIDLGIAYSELGKDKDAIKAMQKAYELASTDTEKYLCAFNLSALFLKIKGFEQAEEYANIAKKINNSEEIQELIMNIKHEKSRSK